MDAITLDRPQLIPGLNSLLGLPRRHETASDEETVEEFCHRISHGRPGPFRVRVDVDGSVLDVTGQVTS